MARLSRLIVILRSAVTFLKIIGATCAVVLTKVRCRLAQEISHHPWLGKIVATAQSLRARNPRHCRFLLKRKSLELRGGLCCS